MLGGTENQRLSFGFLEIDSPQVGYNWKPHYQNILVSLFSRTKKQKRNKQLNIENSFHLCRKCHSEDVSQMEVVTFSETSG